MLSIGFNEFVFHLVGLCFHSLFQLLDALFDVATSAYHHSSKATWEPIEMIGSRGIHLLIYVAILRLLEGNRPVQVRFDMFVAKTA
jgi:hypothetical protein